MSKLKLQATDGSAGTVSLKAPASTTGNAEFELTLPGNAGSNGQLLSTNGSGVLSWSDDNSGVSLSGSTNNTIATVTGANALVGEANLTFDGTSLLTVHVPSATGEPAINFTNSDTGTGTGNGFGLGLNDAESPYIWNRENTDLRIATNNTERARITSTGQLCLGSTANYGTIGYESTLQVRKDVAGGNASIQIVNDAASNASSTCDLNVWQNYRLATRIISGRENASNWQSSASSAASFLSFYTNSAGTVAERMRIDSSGKVGITTASPTTNLNVQGGFHISGTSNQTKTQDGLLFQRNTSSGNCEIIAGRAGGNYTGLEHYIAGASGVTLRQSSDYQGSTKWMSGNGSTELFRIRHDGGVTFNGDTAAANALDDYEYGTFTPTYHNGSVSYEYQHGFYTKVGCLVTVWFDFKVTACSSQSGVPYIAGFPFHKSFNGSSGHYEGVSWWHCDNSFTSSSSCAQGYIGDNSNGLNMYRGNTPQHGNAFVTNQTGRMAGTFSYSAAA